MKPLYKWVGGKGREIKTFKQFYPESFTKYVEPFFGGGAVYFDLKFNDNVINDFNPEVTNFLSLIKQGRNVEIYNEMAKLKNEESFYYDMRKSIPTSDLENAVRFYYMRKTCFRGMIRYNKSGGFNVPYGNYKTYNFEELLNNEYIEVLKNTEIMTGDFSKVFEKYDDHDHFYFLDPPYHDTFSDYNSDGFNVTKHIELADCFKKTKSKCLMIIGKTDFIEEQYKGYIVGAYGKKYSVTTHVNTIPESAHLIIKNY